MSESELISSKEQTHERYYSASQHNTFWKNKLEELQKEEPRLRRAPELRNIKFIIYPDDPLYEYWSFIVALLLLFTAIITPYRLALVDSYDETWLIIDLVIDGLFVVDVFVNCFLAYYNEEMDIITDRKMIFIHYLKGWFLLDTVACIPFSILTESKDYGNLLRFAKFTRVTRAIKLLKLVRMIQLLQSRKRAMRYMNSIFKITIELERIITFLFGFILLIHILACSWAFIGIYKYLSNDNNWITQSGFIDYKDHEIYIAGIYWAITTLTSVGYGDIHPYNSSEKIFTCFVVILGIFVYSYMVGSLTNLVSNLDSRKSKLRKKIEMLQIVSDEYKVSDNLYKKLANAIEYEHTHSRKEVDELIDSLPSKLKSQLLIVIHRKIIEGNSFFEDKPTFFVAWVAPRLKPLRVEAGDIIYRENDYAIDMHFIANGTVSLNSTRDGEITVISKVSKGYYFGELDLLFSIFKSRLFTVKAETSCELLTLAREDFECLLKTFEDQSIEILANARERYARIMKKKDKLRANTTDRWRNMKLASVPGPSAGLRTKEELLEIIKKYSQKVENQTLDQPSSQSNQLSERDPEAENLLEQTSKPPTREATQQIRTDLLEKMNEPDVESTSELESLKLLGRTTLFKSILEEKMKDGDFEIRKIRHKVSYMEESIEDMKTMMSLICHKLNLSESSPIRRVASETTPYHHYSTKIAAASSCIL
jgi:hyperpolarization activated cyclic nucleotide-gated potassium channel 1